VLLAGLALQLVLPQGEGAQPWLAGAWHAPDRRLPAIAEVTAPDLAGRTSLFSPLRILGAQAAALDPAAPGVVALRPVGPLGGAFVLGALRVGGRRPCCCAMRMAASCGLPPAAAIGAGSSFGSRRRRP
jgi:hypothetical protein